MLLTNDQAPLVFANLVESLYFNGLADELPLGLRKTLRESGIDLDRKKLLPAYPRAVWEKCVLLTATQLYPNESVESAMQSLAERTSQAWANTLFGRAMTPMLRLLGPKRALARAKMNFQAGANYVQVEFKETGPTSCELWMNEPSEYRFYMQGMILGGTRATGAKNVKVDIIKNDEAGTTFRVSWTE